MRKLIILTLFALVSTAAFSQGYCYDDVYYCEPEVVYYEQPRREVVYVRESERPNMIVNDYSTTNNYYGNGRPVRVVDRTVTYNLRERGQVMQWTIMFNIESYGLTNASLANLEYIGTDFLRRYPNARFELYAYADVGTGTPPHNHWLAQMRGDAVAQILINRYYVPWQKVNTICMGSDSQVYAHNSWNRCVLVKAFID